MSDEMSGFLDELEQTEIKTKRPSPQRKDLSNPLSQVPTTEARRVLDESGKDRSMVGRQLRRSILIPPEMDEEINRVCKKYKVKKMEMMRYLLGKGLEDIHNGVLEGQLVERVTMELPQPDWKTRK